MNHIGARLVTQHGSVPAPRLRVEGRVVRAATALSQPPASPVATTIPAQDAQAFDLANVSILSAALGFGVYIDTFV